MSTSIKPIEQPVQPMPAPMGLFPTLNSCQSVVDLALSQLPLQTPNAVVGLLMTYHNTLLAEIKNGTPAQ